MVIKSPIVSEMLSSIESITIGVITLQDHFFKCKISVRLGVNVFLNKYFDYTTMKSCPIT